MTEPQYLTIERFESAISTIDSRFEEMISSINGRFDRMDSRFDRNEEVIQSLITSQNLLLKDTREIKSRAIKLEHSVDDVQYSISALSRAEEKDAEATINHENRLKRLEKLNNIEAGSPSHLIDIY